MRSIFISGFTTCVVLALLYALLQLVRGMDPLISWLGLALAAGAPVAFLVSLYIGNHARTPQHPVVISVVCGLGTAITMAANWRYGDASGIVHIWAGLCLLAWFIYLKWYSVFSNRGGSLVPGTVLADFELQSMQGEVTLSSSFRGKKHVFIFYRGNWCPLCSAQITELAQKYRELEAMGAEVVLISSQPQSHSARLAKKFDVPMQFFRDENNSAARKLGVVAPFGTPMGFQLLGYDSDTVMPTVVITDEDGKILFADETDNYRVRPEPELFVNVLRANQGVSVSIAEGLNC